MNEKFKKLLAIATASYIACGVIIHPSGEEPHIHNESYEFFNTGHTISIVTSGTSTSLNNL